MRHPQISLLVPFGEDRDHPHRARLWDWLERYWAIELPDAEIVVGRSRSRVFSKTRAVNDAAARAHGRTFVILDSDVYVHGHDIRACADAIDDSLRRDIPLWFIPYRHLFRLTEASTEKVLCSAPRRPYRFPSPPPRDEVESTLGSGYGHHFGAMIQILPREAFELVGCMDNRFEGWGGEDVAFVRALDTLYAKHKTTDTDVLHLWHPSVGTGFQTRMWAGQARPRTNEQLASRYDKATGDRAAMRQLVDEGCRSARCWRCCLWPWLLAAVTVLAVLAWLVD